MHTDATVNIPTKTVAGIMETFSVFATDTFNLFLFLSILNVANSEDDNYHSNFSVRSVVDILPAISLFIFVVVGIVLCGFCSKSKSNDSSEEDLSSPDYDNMCLEDFTVQNGDVRTNNVPDDMDDADIYDCVNQTTVTSPRSLDECNHGDSCAEEVIVDETKMIYNIAYQSVDGYNDIYDQVNLNVGEGATNIDEESGRFRSSKKVIAKSLSEPINSTLLSYSGNGEVLGQNAETAPAEDEPIYRTQTAPADIGRGSKKKLSKTMTLQFGGSLHTPLDSLPEEDYDVVQWPDERSGNDSSSIKASPDARERSQTLGPNMRRQTEKDALVYELSKIQKMRKGVTYKKGGTLPPQGNLRENIREVENISNVTDDKINQVIEAGSVSVTCHSNNDDVASQQSFSSCSGKSDSDSVGADSFTNSCNDSNLSQTLGPNARRQAEKNALVYELSKVQKMRKGVTHQKGGTLPPQGNLSENIREVENKSSMTDDKINQAIETGSVSVTCHSNNDDEALLESASSCSGKSDSDSFDADSFSNSGDDANLQDNEQLDSVAMDTLEPSEEYEDSNLKRTKHNYVNVDVSTDFHSEILEEDDDTATYGNLGAYRDFLCEVTTETGLRLPSEEAGTSSGQVEHTQDTDQIYATFRYEDAKVDMCRRSTKVKRAALVKEEDEDDENDDIFYPDQDKTEDNGSASHTVIAHDELGKRTESVDNHDSPSQKRPHKIFTNESFLRIEEAIAMQQAVNNSPAEKVPAFCRRWRVQRFSL